jgi:hypothetical protein
LSPEEQLLAQAELESEMKIATLPPVLPAGM